MEERNLISTHTLQSDYSKKGKLKTIIIGWCIFLIIFIITKLPNVREILLNIQSSDTVQSVEWVESLVNFILNGLWVLFIPFVIGTVITLKKKHPFQSLNIYETGIGFVCDGKEKFSAYSNMKLSFGSMQQSVNITCKEAEIKGNEYGFGEFSQSDVLLNNLKRYSNI